MNRFSPRRRGVKKTCRWHVFSLRSRRLCRRSIHLVLYRTTSDSLPQSRLRSPAPSQRGPSTDCHASVSKKRAPLRRKKAKTWKRQQPQTTARRKSGIRPWRFAPNPYKSGRRLTISWPADLPQNRAYRSGTRLLPCLCRYRLAVVRIKELEFSLLKPLV